MIGGTAPERNVPMAQMWKWIGPIAIWATAFVVVVRPHAMGAQGSGWTIPQTAAAQTNPIVVTEATLAAGKKLFASKCERCHGPAGKGDGEDANPDHLHDMDLTKGDDAAQNPDGVVFYKVWNGRSSPQMPAFSEQITADQAWTIVAYVQTLRPKS
jgi:mono/diheme cytochrome c family protein